MELDTTTLLTIVGLVGSSFIATNLDNLLLLVVLQGANRRRRGLVLVGYLTSAVLVVLVSAIGVMIGEVLDAGLVGYLGLVPLLLGCRMLYLAWAREHDTQEGVETMSGETAAGLWLGTTGLMMGNSGDSIAVLLPLLADTSKAGEGLIVVSYLAVAVLWAALAGLISGQRHLALRLELGGEKIVPWIMIGVGLYILLDTATDNLG